MFLHFFVKIFSVFSPYIFQSTRGIDPNEIGVLDYCPICEEKLPDKRVITFKRHEIAKHKKTDKEALKEFITRSGLFWLFMIIPIFGVLMFVTTPVLDYLDEMDGWTHTDQCRKTLYTLNMALYEQKELKEENLDSLQFLFAECYGSMSMFPEPFFERDSIFNDEEGYKSTKEFAEKKGYIEIVESPES